MKNTYYFPHDYHARHDPKLERLRMLYGCVTDGVYWCLVEMMYEQGGYLAMDDMPVFAKLLNTDIDIVNKVIGSDLFKQEGGKCYSDAVLDRLTHINKVREDRKHAGKLGGDAKAVANAKQVLSNIKERKVNNKEIVTPQDFVLSLKTKPEYKHIHIDNELLKMDTWLARNPGRKKTPRFILRWLNKIEAPIGAVSTRRIPS